jgi:uncharacterized protein YvpB
MAVRRYLAATGVLVGMMIPLAAALMQRPDPGNQAPPLSASGSPVVATPGAPLRASTLGPAHARIARPTSTLPGAAPTVTPRPTLEVSVDLPDSFYITNVSGHRQWFSIGCEASAAVDWADYFGVSINEREFQSLLQVSDNPDLGFVGDVNGTWGLTPPNDYGVHAGPVAELLRWYGLDAIARRELSLEDIEASIAQSKPVIAWVVGNVTYGTPIEYEDQEGNVTTVAAYEHVVIVTGYNSISVRYLNNGEYYDVSKKLFLSSWGVLGNMAILMENEVQEH